MTAAVSTLFLAPAASAAPAYTVPLEPQELVVGLAPVESSGGVVNTVDRPTAALDAPLQRLQVAWGGSITVDIPPQLVSTGGIALGLHEPGGDAMDPTKSYSRGSADPSTALAVTDLGSNRLRIDLPADDGANGPHAVLRLTQFPTASGGVQFMDSVTYALELSPSAPATLALSPLLISVGQLAPAGSAPAVQVSPGKAFDVTLPANGRLAQVGVADLRTSAYSLRALGAGGEQTGTVVPLAADDVAADGLSSRLTVPAGTAAGRYELTALLGDGTRRVVSTVTGVVEVRAGNAGLRSNTGWGEEEAGTSPLVPIGAGMLLVGAAGVGLQLRRRTATEG